MSKKTEEEKEKKRQYERDYYQRKKAEKETWFWLITKQWRNTKNKKSI